MKFAKSMMALTLAAGLAAGNASAQSTFSAGSYSANSLGSQTGSLFDTFTISGVPLASINAATETIGVYDFTVGPNCNPSPSASNCLNDTSNVSGTTNTFSLTIGGQTQEVLFPWKWSSTGAVDTLTIGGNAPALTYNFPTERIIVTGLAFGPLSSDGSNGGTVTGNVLASFQTVAVPEPETYAMILAGLGLMGVVARRRLRRL